MRQAWRTGILSAGLCEKYLLTPPTSSQLGEYKPGVDLISTANETVMEIYNALRYIAGPINHNAKRELIKMI